MLRKCTRCHVHERGRRTISSTQNMFVNDDGIEGSILHQGKKKDKHKYVNEKLMVYIIMTVDYESVYMFCVVAIKMILE